jgi:ribosome-binding factor A
MSAFKEEKTKEQIIHLAGEFFSKEASRLSLITVTSLTLSSDFKNAQIYITVYPTTKEGAALEFCKRNLSELRHYIQKNSKLSRIPFFGVNIDKGEKNRQRVEEISQGI